MTTVTKQQTKSVFGATKTDDVTQYLAYIGVICTAVFVAIAAITFSAQTALVWIDAAARPTASQPPATVIEKPAPVTFAMLPASMPVDMKTTVITSNF